MPNGGDGIKIDGRAHGNAIGGFQPSIEPEVTVSSNLGYGIEVTGHARGNAIVHTKVGSNALGTIPLGNAMGGIALGRGTSTTTIGGAALPFAVDVLYNAGSGVSMFSSKNNTVVGTRILANAAYGVVAVGNCNGSVIRGSTIAANGLGNVNITRAGVSPTSRNGARRWPSPSA